MSWPRDAYVGQRVVAILPTESKALTTGEVSVKVGVVYTISGIILNATGDDIGFHLKEIQMPPVMVLGMGTVMRAFSYRHFRPIDETKIDVFRKLLTPVKEDA
jgi:hypothetical protein